MKDIDPKALFRLSVLGPLVSRERLERGELQQIIRELAQRDYAIPDSKDGTVSYLGRRFEVPYELSGKDVRLVVDPHAQRVVGVEDEAGVSLGAATELDRHANQHRTRRKPVAESSEVAAPGTRSGPNLVEIALVRHHAQKVS